MRECQIIAVGATAAAAQALSMFLVGLPESFSLPVVLVIPDLPVEGGDLGVRLQAHCVLPVQTIDDKDPLLGGRVHVAPADYHLLVERTHFALSTEAPVDGARPSIDVLFESVADAYGDKAVGILLTGEGREGERGAARIRARGGLVIVHNPATAASGGVVPGAVEADTVPASPAPRSDDSSKVLHLSEIAPYVSRLCEAELT